MGVRGPVQRGDLSVLQAKLSGQLLARFQAFAAYPFADNARLLG